MKRVLLLVVLAMIVFCANAQINPWKQVSLTSSVSKGKDVFQKHFKPSAYVSFQLNEAAMKAELQKAPNERNAAVSRSSSVISVPNSKGQIERFRVVEAPSMEAALVAKFPDIKSYSGQSLDHPGSSIRFDMSPLGFHATVMSADRTTFYISCVDKASKSYIVYERELTVDKKYSFDCLLDETLNSNIQGKSGKGGITDKNANTNTLRIYRLALNLTGEFSRAVLADVAPGTDTSTTALKKAIVLALANSITTEANFYFENEMHLRLVLIGTETNIIYLDPASDPFSTWTTTFVTTTWNAETQTNCTNVIGNTNYDIGHMLTYNTEKNNGNAGCIGCVCTTPSGSVGKGRGWNMYGEYQGYYLVVDYWTHEMGHQFGGNHTFTHNYENTIAQVEPGSGTTIMAYAGITGATDVQTHSDPYFSCMSIQQITDYIQTGGGSACGTTLALTNNLPAVNAGADYTVPKSTPFILTGTSTDADAADVRTYSWEQIDARSSSSNTYPTATSTAGPMFRFFPPVTSLSRTFPRMEVVLDSVNTGKWEVLPSVARTLNFRLTVRDNHSGISANESDDSKVTIGTAGPFLVTAPNTGVSYASGSTQTITWSVNSTNTATYATNVKVTMSADGGQTFPYVLSASTTNDGTESLALPNITSGACRIKVEAVGNIFFDVSDVNFALGACGTAVGLGATSITATTATLSWTAVTGATSYDVDYRIAGAASWTTGVAATTSTSLNLTGLVQGTDYEFRVKTNCSFNNGAFATEVFSTLCSVAPTGLTASAITNSTATISWTAAAGAASYKVDYKLTTESIWVRAANATTSTSVNISNLIANKTYDFRVRSNCASSLAYSGYTSSTFTSLCSAAPTGLAASAITNSSVTLGWTASGGASSYTVDYKLASSGSWTNAVTATTSTTVNVSGLTQGLLYDYRVKINCASGSTSYTSAQFTTLCSVAPSGLAASAVTNASATVSWSATSGAVSYDVDYKLASSGTWTNAATATTSTSVNLSSLAIGAQYDYRVRVNCSVGTTSYTSAQFTTLCNVAPTGLAASAVTNASATVSWTASSGAVSYDVDYKLASSGTWTNAATATTSTSVNLSSLTTGAQYDYRVRANCAAGTTSYTSAQFTTLCNVAPTGLAASAVTNASATVSWSASAGAVSYDVDYKLASSGTWTNAVSATTSTSVNLSSLTTGAQYDYRVRANCASGSTSYTSASFTTLCNVAPTGLAASAVTNASATVSWTASSGAVSYDVDYKLASSGTWTNAVSATTSTSVNLSSLTTGAQYDYRVRANCASGSTSYTSASFTTLCNVAPTGLAASAVTNASATVSWTASSGAVSYDVDYKLASSGTWTNAATATTSTSVNLSSLTTGAQYDYRVRANCAAGTTSYTSAQFTTLCNVAPTGLAASAVTNASATVSWSASAGAVSYDVDYKLASSGTWTNAVSATTSTSVNLSSLTTGAQYDYRVRANCAAGTTSYTSAQFTTLCNVAPTGLAASAVTNASATVSWTASSGAVSYDVDYKLASSGTWTNAVSATTSTSVNLSSLTTGAQYDYRVRANCASGSTSYTSAQFTTLCNVAPNGLAASAVANASATVSWSASAGAVSYDVDYKLASSGTWTNAVSATTSTSVNLSSLTTGAQYDYRVRANCASGSTSYTSASFTTLCNVAPTGLAASAVTNASATVSWSASAGAVSYDVDYKLASSGTWTNAATATTSTSVNLSSLTTGAQYDYRVRANCASGTTSYTSAQFTTLCNVAPTGLAASAVTNASATVSWTASSGAVSYDVDYKLASSGTWTNAVSATTSTSVNLSSLTTGAQYDYRVRANCASGSTSYTSASFTTLCNVAPTGLAASAVTNASATVSWSASAGAVSYDVDYKLASSGTWTNAVSATTSTSVNLSSLTTGAQYDYRVRANCASGSTSYTSAQFTTLCNVAPTGLAASAVTTSSATLSWSAATGATSYDVDYKAASSGTWINAATATASTSVSVSGLNYSTTYDWRVRTNCASGSSSYSSAQFTTDIPVCNVPSGLASSSITTSSATVSWGAVTGAASYDVDYKASSSGTWINAATATASTSVSVSGLNYSTTYDWRVRTNCIYGNTSAYSQAQFTTNIPACDAPVNLVSSSVTASSASISWDAVSSAASYNVDYKLTSSGTWINVATGTTSTSANVSGLNYSSSYDWRVRTNCTYGNTSSYSQAQFTTDIPACDAPAGLTATGLSATGATISWSAVSSAASYDVDYKMESSSTWINAASGTTSLSVTLTGLSSSTNYDWRVRTNCTYGNTSTYTAAQFRTYLAAGCGFPTTLTTTNITGVSATLNWSAVSGALSYDAGYRISGTTNWINAAALTTATSVNISGLADESVYEWRVRANCASESGIFNSVQFTTLYSTSCPGKYDTVSNNSFANAVLVPVSRDIYGRIEVANDVDYYKFTASAAGKFSISLTNLPKNYNIYLYNSSFVLLDSSIRTGTINELISKKVTKGTHYVKVVGLNATMYSSTLCYTLNIAPPVASKEGVSSKTETTTKQGVRVYPNPAFSSINISTDKMPANADIKITDVYGRGVMQLKALSSNTRVDVSKLNSGTYFITITSKEGSVLYNTKFIKY